jgi:predicted HTH domain antitoxin
MSGSSVSVNIPEDLLNRIPDEAGDVEARVTEALVLHLFQTGRLSLGRAADTLGIEKDEFRRLISRRGVPYFNMTVEDVLRDADRGG